jgi:hypothetical protein
MGVAVAGCSQKTIEVAAGDAGPTITLITDFAADTSDGAFDVAADTPVQTCATPVSTTLQTADADPATAYVSIDLASIPCGFAIGASADSWLVIACTGVDCGAGLVFSSPASGFYSILGSSIESVDPNGQLSSLPLNQPIDVYVVDNYSLLSYDLTLTVATPGPVITLQNVSIPVLSADAGPDIDTSALDADSP